MATGVWVCRLRFLKHERNAMEVQSPLMTEFVGEGCWFRTRDLLVKTGITNLSWDSLHYDQTPPEYSLTICFVHKSEEHLKGMHLVSFIYDWVAFPDTNRITRLYFKQICMASAFCVDSWPALCIDVRGFPSSFFRLLILRRHCAQSKALWPKIMNSEWTLSVNSECLCHECHTRIEHQPFLGSFSFCTVQRHVQQWLASHVFCGLDYTKDFENSTCCWIAWFSAPWA